MTWADREKGKRDIFLPGFNFTLRFYLTPLRNPLYKVLVTKCTRSFVAGKFEIQRRAKRDEQEEDDRCRI